MPHNSPWTLDAVDLSKTQTGLSQMEAPKAGGSRLKLVTFDKSLAITPKRQPTQASSTYHTERPPLFAACLPCCRVSRGFVSDS